MPSRSASTGRRRGGAPGRRRVRSGGRRGTGLRVPRVPGAPRWAVGPPTTGASVVVPGSVTLWSGALGRTASSVSRPDGALGPWGRDGKGPGAPRPPLGSDRACTGRTGRPDARPSTGVVTSQLISYRRASGNRPRALWWRSWGPYCSWHLTGGAEQSIPREHEAAGEHRGLLDRPDGGGSRSHAGPRRSRPTMGSAVAGPRSGLRALLGALPLDTGGGPCSRSRGRPARCSPGRAAGPRPAAVRLVPALRPSRRSPPCGRAAGPRPHHRLPRPGAGPPRGRGRPGPRTPRAEREVGEGAPSSPW